MSNTNTNNNTTTVDANDPRPSGNPYTDPASDQLGQFARAHANDPPKNRTTSAGAPNADALSVLTVGPRGPVLEDYLFMEAMSHASRERIPERMVHAKGAGAFGYFETTSSEITKYCKASLFSRVGKRTECLVRFSTIFGERGSADTVRDGRGFAIKLYTDEGNWDLVCTNSPTFFVRDPFLFVQFTHTLKRNPKTNLTDNNARWDLFNQVPESFHMMTRLFSDYGIPDGYRHMDAFGENTFKMVNANGQVFYNKFHLRTDQGAVNLDPTVAAQIAGEDSNYSTHDLYNAIARSDFPSWTLLIQIMTPEQAKGFEFNPFDLTKTWPEDRFPLIEVGRLTLNRNLDNYFVQNELVSFSPATLVPGIELSPDKTLKARAYAYGDTQRYRVGPNFGQVPVNEPKVPTYNPRFRDGRMTVNDNAGNAPNYYPNSFDKTINTPRPQETREETEETDTWRYKTEEEDNYSQVREVYLSYAPDMRQRLHQNIANDLGQTYDFIQKRTLEHLELIHKDYAAGVRQALQALRAGK